MEEFALIKSRVNLNRVNQALALICDIKVFSRNTVQIFDCNRICKFV